jgi:hypothetical protein
VCSGNNSFSVRPSKRAIESQTRPTISPNATSTSRGSAGIGAAAGINNTKRRQRRNRNRGSGKKKEGASEDNSKNNSNKRNYKERKKSQSSAEDSSNNMGENIDHTAKTFHPNINMPVEKNAINLPVEKNATESPKDIRQWFSSLSADDRAVALGFIDGSVISAVSRLAFSLSDRASTPSTILEPPGEERMTDEPLKIGRYSTIATWSGNNLELMFPRRFSIQCAHVSRFVEACLFPTKHSQTLLSHSHHLLLSLDLMTAVDTMIDWEAKVLVKDIENCSVLQEVMDGEQDELGSQSAVDVPKDSLLSDDQTADVAADSSSTKSAGEGETKILDAVEDGEVVVVVMEEAPKLGDDVESDAFRIRGDAEETTIDVATSVASDEAATKGDSEEETGSKPGEKEVSTEELPLQPETSIRPLSGKVSDIMGKLCAVFPSAFQLVKPDVADVANPCPRITVHPSYLSTVNGEDLLSSLDEIMLESKFLSDDQTTTPSSSSWMDAVRAASNNDPSSDTDTSTIPLYMLLLLRFQIAVFDTYHRSITSAAEHEHEESSVDIETEPSLKGDKKTPYVEATAAAPPSNTHHSEDEISTKDALLVQSADQPSTAEEDPIINETSSQPDTPTETSESSSCIQLLPSLTARLSSLQKNIDADKLSEILSPLSSCFPELSQSEQQTLENSLLMPLVPVIQKCRAEKSRSFEDTLKTIDVAMAETITLLCQQEDSTANVVVSQTTAEPASSCLAVVQSTPNDNTNTNNNEEPKGTSATAAHVTEPIIETAASISPPGSPGKKNTKKKKKKKVSYLSDDSGPPTCESNSKLYCHDYNQKRKSGTREQPPQAKEDNSFQNDEEKTPETVEKEVQTSSSESDEITDDIALNTTPETSAPATVTPVGSFDTDRSVAISESADDMSTPASKEDASVEAGDNDADAKSGLYVSSADGVAPTSIVVSQPGPDESKMTANSEEKAISESEATDPNQDNQDIWETVEVRSRGNRKKGADRTNQGRFSSQQGYGASSNSGQNGNGAKKSKGPRSKASRNRTTNRKMVREILSSVLDAVEVEARKRRISQPWRPTGNRWAVAPAKSRTNIYGGRLANSADAQKANNQKKLASMRDILVGKQGNNSGKGMSGNSSQVAQRVYLDRVRQRPALEINKKNREKNERATSGSGPKTSGTQTADQNTAPTLPETLSAVSTNSAYTEAPSTKNVPPRDTGVGRSDSSSGGSAEATKPQPQVGKESSPSPPLPTLLSSGNGDSATSSVASSLDAPHAIHHGNHENDVGYHLLHVCDKLTRDIGVFMKRRDLALEVRRRERGSVLGALQETLSVSTGFNCYFFLMCNTNSTNLFLFLRAFGRDCAQLRCMAAVPPTLTFLRRILMLSFVDLTNLSKQFHISRRTQIRQTFRQSLKGRRTTKSQK